MQEEIEITSSDAASAANAISVVLSDSSLPAAERDALVRVVTALEEADRIVIVPDA